MEETLVDNPSEDSEYGLEGYSRLSAYTADKLKFVPTTAKWKREFDVDGFKIDGQWRLVLCQLCQEGYFLISKLNSDYKRYKPVLAGLEALELIARDDKIIVPTKLGIKAYCRLKGLKVQKKEKDE